MLSRPCWQKARNRSHFFCCWTKVCSHAQPKASCDYTIQEISRLTLLQTKLLHKSNLNHLSFFLFHAGSSSPYPKPTRLLGLRRICIRAIGQTSSGLPHMCEIERTGVVCNGAAQWSGSVAARSILASHQPNPLIVMVKARGFILAVTMEIKGWG